MRWAKYTLKCTSFILALLFILYIFPVAAMAAVTDADRLQMLIDTTPSGGTLVLDRPYICNPSNNATGYAHYVYINKPITIKGLLPFSGIQIENIKFKVTKKNVTIENISMREGCSVQGGYIYANGNANNLTIKDCIFTSDEYTSSLKNFNAKQGGYIFVSDIKNTTIENCTFKNGTASWCGGAVYASMIDGLTVKNCTFKNNGAKFGANLFTLTEGGAIYVSVSSNIRIEQSVFENNQAQDNGGGVKLHCCMTAVLDGCSFINNSVVRQNEMAEMLGRGGGIAFTSRTDDVYLNNCDFINNDAYYGGGAYVGRSKNIVFNDCEFSSNQTLSHIDVEEPAMSFLSDIICAVVFLDIEAFCKKIVSYLLIEATTQGVQFGDGINKLGGEGGAIYSIDSKIMVDNCEVTENECKKIGAGIYLANSKGNIYPNVIRNTYFKNNVSKNVAGAIAIFSNKTTVENCLFDSNRAIAGGAIYNAAHSEIFSSEFTGNYAETGGALCVDGEYGTTSIEDGTFEDNSALYGGAIHANHGTINVAESEFTQNYAVNKGGAIAAVGAGLEIAESHFAQNAADTGGAIHQDDSSKAKITESLFLSNKAKDGGGAIKCIDIKSFNISSSTFEKNETVTGGGAIDFRGDATITDCKFYKNSANEGAGALYITKYTKYYSSEAVLKRNIFQKNICFEGAGAISLSDDTSLYMQSSLLTHNQTNELFNQGSVLDISDEAYAEVINCTIVNNNPPGELPSNMMSAIYLRDDSKIELFNNIIGSNTVIENVGEKDIQKEDNAKIIAKNNICAVTGNNNIQTSVDIFGRGVNDDYHVNNTNIIDKGTTQGVDYFPEIDWSYPPNTQLPLDVDGNLRTVDNDGNGETEPDLGAYESQKIRAIFHDALPNETALGDIESGHVQQISYGGTIDFSAVSLSTDAECCFKSWVLSDGTPIDEHAPVYNSVNLYATYIRERVDVNFEYDSEKVEIISAPEGTKYNNRFVISQEVGVEIIYPEFKGINGNVFNGYSSEPTLVTEETTIQVNTISSAVFHFGAGGYYREGDEYLSEWVTLQVNPLEVPDSEDIVTYSDVDFLGWSETEGGSVIQIMPDSVTEGKEYYAVYDTAEYQIALYFDGLSYKPGFSPVDGTYPHGTKFVLNELGIMTFYEVFGWGGNEIIYGKDDRGSYYHPDAEIVLVRDMEIYVEFGRNTDILPNQSCMHLVSFNAKENGILLPVNEYGGTYKIVKWGQVVNLSEYDYIAIPDVGYEFVGWKNKDGELVDSFIMDGNINLYAHFKRKKHSFLLNPYIAQKESFNIENSVKDKLSALSTTDVEYDEGMTIWLTDADAPDLPGHHFLGFTDEQGNYVSAVLINGERRINAVYEPITYTVTLTSSGNGAMNQRTIYCNYDDVIDLSSEFNTPDEGYVLSHFEDENGSNVGDSYTVTGDQVLTAVFVGEELAAPDALYTLTIISEGGGSVLAGLEGQYAKDTEVLLDNSCVQADEGCQFEGFKVDGDIVDSVTMDSDKTVNACFGKKKYCVTIRKVIDDEIVGVAFNGWFPSDTNISLSEHITQIEGYVCKGVYDKDMNEVEEINISDDITLYAVFEPQSEQPTATPSPVPTTTLAPTPTTVPTTTTQPAKTPTPSSTAIAEVPETGVTEAQDVTDQADEVDAMPLMPMQKGLAWYWWVMIAVGALTAAGAIWFAFFKRRGK